MTREAVMYRPMSIPCSKQRDLVKSFGFLSSAIRPKKAAWPQNAKTILHTAEKPWYRSVSTTATTPLPGLVMPTAIMTMMTEAMILPNAVALLVYVVACCDGYTYKQEKAMTSSPGCEAATK